MSIERDAWISFSCNSSLHFCSILKLGELCHRVFGISKVTENFFSSFEKTERKKTLPKILVTKGDKIVSG